jgi:putative redox protein
MLGTRKEPTVTTHRWIELERPEPGVFVVRNARGGELRLAAGTDDETFTPVELFLAAIGSCTAADVDVITGRRAQPEVFRVRVDAHKDRDDFGNFMRDIVVTFEVRFPEGPEGDAAREALPRAIEVSHDRSCTVSRTVRAGTPVEARIV